MNTAKNLAQTIWRIVALLIRHVVSPIARFIHLEVKLNAEDDGFWVGLGLLVLVNLVSWLMK
jgi:hypothetical protein